MIAYFFRLLKGFWDRSVVNEKGAEIKCLHFIARKQDTYFDNRHTRLHVVDLTPEFCAHA